MAKKRRLIVDGDIPLYQIGFAVETAVDWGGDFWSLSGDMNEARESMVIWVEKLKAATKTADVVIALSGSDNWRKGLEPQYKANRKNVRKPVVFNPLRDFIRNRWEVLEEDGLEADDLLGLNAGRVDILCSSDKDLMTVPGRHFNPNKPEDGIRRVTEREADYNLLVQALTGDSTDNYPGCPGVGPVSARKMLDGLDSEEWWPAVVQRYAKAGLPEETALLQARLAYILRPGSYDYETKEVELWMPPSA
jgi:DNA polymerase I